MAIVNMTIWQCLSSSIWSMVDCRSSFPAISLEDHVRIFGVVFIHSSLSLDTKQCHVW